jgi:hypothetical protein
MICSNCGTFLPDGIKFCSECGANLDGSDDWEGSVPKKPARYKEPEYDNSWDEPYRSSPAKKPASKPRRYQESGDDYGDRNGIQEPQRIIIEHARKKGDDISTGFGRSFGETIGRKAGGCAWSLGIIVIIIIVIVIFGFLLG